jgi:hypothetical protein
MARSPYPGLRSFERNEADLFFGRETHVDAMIDRLAQHRLLAVTGSSGSGKSSLVRAGLLEALETGLLAAAGPVWRFAILRPREHPMSELAAALLEALGQPHGVDDISLRRAALERGPLSLIEELREQPLPDGTNLLVLVDQFEELFRYQGLADRERAEGFVALLLASAAQREIPIYVVLTMRSDFFGECARFDGLSEAICDSLYLCPRLSRDQIVATIEGPARVCGGDVEPQLVVHIVNDMGVDSDQLPLMQHALMRLWDQAQSRDTKAPLVRLEDYLAADGLKGSLPRHADEILAELSRDSPGRRDIARHLFCLLIEGEGEHAVRRLAPVSEVMAVSEQPFEELTHVADAFRAPAASLLTPPLERPLTEETVLDVSHEALIRQWQRLKDWVHDEALAAEQYLTAQRQVGRWVRGEQNLRDPRELDAALKWRRTSPTWTARYGGDPEGMMRYLDIAQGRRNRVIGTFIIASISFFLYYVLQCRDLDTTISDDLIYHLVPPAISFIILMLPLYFFLRHSFVAAQFWASFVAIIFFSVIFTLYSQYFTNSITWPSIIGDSILNRPGNQLTLSDNVCLFIAMIFLIAGVIFLRRLIRAKSVV